MLCDWEVGVSNPADVFGKVLYSNFVLLDLSVNEQPLGLFFTDTGCEYSIGKRVSCQNACAKNF